jgi:uncharacterized membrane protein
MAWLGLLLGALVGAYVHGFSGLVAGAVVGTIVGLLWRRFSPDGVSTLGAAPARVLELERRVAALELELARLRRGADALVRPMSSDASGLAPTTEVSLGEAPSAKPVAEPPSRHPVRKGGAGDVGAEQPALQPSASSVAAHGKLWRWFTDGSAVVRTGVVVLFFGVAFLLSYFAEHVTVPIQLQFLGVALGGLVLIAIGARLHPARAAYALALIGGGFGVLYLTTFAAAHLVPLLAPATAFAILASLAGLAIGLSLRFDAQPLAVLAALGGLLAPVLVQTVSEPIPLFGYVAVVNVVVIGVAWFRTWRTLDLTGFVGTFLLGVWWGHEYYEPGYFATVEPVLVLFFALYVALPIVHALRGAGGWRFDAVLVLGVPFVAFALQAALVQEMRYGLAWSAAVAAVLYAALAGAVRGRVGTEMLAAAYGGLAVIFATLVVPLALDARWTSAVWAVEAAGVYWVGVRMDRTYVRVFGLLLQFAAGAAFFFYGWEEYAGPAFINGQFLGGLLIAVSALATVRFADGRGDALPQGERSLLHLVFGWGCFWWLAAGAEEIIREFPRHEAHAILAWIAGGVAAGTWLGAALRWPRLNSTAIILLPAIALAVAHDVWHGRTTLTSYGWVLYPLCWGLHFVLLHRAELRLPAADDAASLRERTRIRSSLGTAHFIGAVLLLAQLAWEAGEWTARIAPWGTVWPACAHVVPLALFLMGAHVRAWPLGSFPDAYASWAGAIAATALSAGALALALLQPGDARPLPYVALLNPLDLTLALALLALHGWMLGEGRIGSQARYAWLGAGAFIALNSAVVRAVHHWLGVPWQLSEVLASKPLQAALTLAWTGTALAAMIVASRRGLRPLWLMGAALLGVVVIKLFAIDLATLSGLTRVVAFLGVGAMLLVIGYLTPLPPADRGQQPGARG